MSVYDEKPEPAGGFIWAIIAGGRIWPIEYIVGATQLRAICTDVHSYFNSGSFKNSFRKSSLSFLTRCRVAPTCRRLQKAGIEQSKPGTSVHPLRCASPTSGLSFQGTQPLAEKRTYELALEAHPPARYANCILQKRGTL